MKTRLLSILLGIGILFASGCGILHKNQGVIGKAQLADNKAKAQIELVDNTAAKVNVQRLDKIGAFSAGVDYSLKKETNQSPAVITAAQMNQRVQALANKPDFGEVQAVVSICDELMTNRIAGERALAKKDKEVLALNNQVKDLAVQRDAAVKGYIKVADANAALTDQYKASLKQLDSWGGLGAIWYGVKKLVIRLAWVFGVGGVLFIVLRIASMSNPIAASIFGIFDLIGSWVVNAIKLIVPKALTLAGNVSVAVFDTYKNTLTKVVDAIQTAKTDAAKTGKPIDIASVLNELATTMDSDEKAIVTELLKDLNWKQ